MAGKDPVAEEFGVYNPDKVFGMERGMLWIARTHRGGSYALGDRAAKARDSGILIRGLAKLIRPTMVERKVSPP